jgi:spore photoproduct lyase
MKFELDEIVIEEGVLTSPLASRVLARTPRHIPVRQVADGRDAIRPNRNAADPFGTGKRRMVIMRRGGPFLMACPAGSAEFACCGYMVLALASNCPMDCSYCFLQEYLADNPGLQVYANYAEAFEELERAESRMRGRSIRVGTGEFADSLAFDRTTGISRDLVEFFSTRNGLVLELKTKTDEIDNLLAIDPKGRTIVSWTLSTDHVFEHSETHTAAPKARMAAARRALEAGYKIAFHLDPVIAYEGAERDYLALLDELFDTVSPSHISFMSLGGLRMTPTLRTSARRRHPHDPLLCGEEVLSRDGRYRTFTPLRVALLGTIQRRIASVNPTIMRYLCMEPPGIQRRVLGYLPGSASTLGGALAGH